ncbi:TetR/AcrR family transcriptional regulator [Cellulosilyticum lentocellum]|uniref:Regulatory protein TetR n=1 Tax=Cellulosilyticum lentocellum (strain ATCC 49066 / DSM 5427 / NCIMB 11756 / RHM5) TaxID=642492 RepID=F2JQI6_CELLD|nr:TetR/AcrR family transcriptional regulator [Cellulosilyticum lentocellum]ADZ84970.1 regulatory protein TetR [Cellulosilyticum lentocellum DSM 5427]
MKEEQLSKISEQRREAILKSAIIEFSQKPYKEASTDQITKQCSISKGLLFHYFKSKKDLYLVCLEQALMRLMTKTKETKGEAFYEIIFSAMDHKFNQCLVFPEEMRVVNMAAREMSKDVFEEKSKLLMRYILKGKEESAKTMTRAVSTLKLREPQNPKVTAAFLVYVNAVMNHYLELYKERPDDFFAKAGEIKKELKAYLDCMLYGIVGEE